MAELETLRKELPPIDLTYVRRNHPKAMALARNYRTLRASILSLDDLEAIEATRVAKAKLLAAL